MRDIYRQCSHCILWLGEIPSSVGEKDAEGVFQFIQRVADAQICPPGQHDATGEGEVKHDVFANDDIPALFQDNEKGKAARRAFAAFAMHGNTWWSRVWTIQESILPSSATFVWGPLSISRNAVLLFARRIKRGSLGSLPCFPSWFQAQRNSNDELIRWLIYPVNGFIYSLQGEAPLNVLLRWRHRRATDPRDKVYALLGLFPPESLPSAQACSYSVSARDLYAMVTVDLIRGENGLRALLGVSEMVHQTPGLPSWAIDFACCNYVGKRQLKWWGHSHRYQQFSACGNQALDLDVSEKGDAIRMTGVYIDRVTTVGSVYTVTDDQPLSAHSLWSTITQSQSLLTNFLSSHPHLSTYPSSASSSFTSAFFRTQIGDLIMEEYPISRAQSTHEKDFNETLQRLKPKDRITTDAPPTIHIDPQRDTIPGYDSTPSLTLESLSGMIPNHTFFITSTGYMGIGPPGTAPGDQVWVFYGGNVPFIMRPVSGENENKNALDDDGYGDGCDDDDGYDDDARTEVRTELRLVGDAYVQGIMDGEAVVERVRRGVETEARSVWIR